MLKTIRKVRIICQQRTFGVTAECMHLLTWSSSCCLPSSSSHHVKASELSAHSAVPVHPRLIGVARCAERLRSPTRLTVTGSYRLPWPTVGLPCALGRHRRCRLGLRNSCQPAEGLWCLPAGVLFQWKPSNEGASSRALSCYER